MEPARHKQPLTLKAFAIWTALATTFLGLTVWAVATRSVDALTGTIVFFFPTIIIAFCLSWPARWDRLLPASVATAIVGVWPLYRWLVLGEWRPVSMFLFIAGFFNAMVVGFTAFEFARRRWGAEASPVRRRLMS